MPATVIVNFMTVVHASSSGTLMLFPDVCLTPAPPAPAPIPIPYPNISMSSDTSDGSSTVKCDGNPVMLQDSKFKMSSGDEAGSAQGVVSHKIKGKAEFVSFSFDVKMDGKMVCRQLDPMFGNEMSSKPPNTPPAPELQPPAILLPILPAPTGDWSVTAVSKK